MYLYRFKDIILYAISQWPNIMNDEYEYHLIRDSWTVDSYIENCFVLIEF